MPILGLTSAQAKLARWLIRAAGESIPAALAWLATDLAGNGSAPSNLEWRRFVLTWTRATPSGVPEDMAQFKLDLLNITSDEVDNTWTTADYTAVENALGPMQTALMPIMSPSQIWNTNKAYRMQFNPTPDITRPFADAGPPVHVASSIAAGTQTGVLPYQVAPTVTLRTAWPKHWGRIYLPTPGTAALDANGRLTSSYRSAAGGALKTALGALHDAGFYPVIPVGQLNKAPFHGLLGVTAVVVDDVPDVQRRRRPKRAAARTIA